MSETSWTYELHRFDDKLVDTPCTLRGEQRYFFYRRKGIEPDEARLAAIAWEDNMEEQRRRRDSHDTGYERR